MTFKIIILIWPVNIWCFIFTCTQDFPINPNTSRRSDLITSHKKCKHKADTLVLEPEECRRNRRKQMNCHQNYGGTEEQQVPHFPVPSTGFVPASPLQQFKSSQRKLDPREERTVQRAIYCHSDSLLPRRARKRTLETHHAQADELATRDQMFLYSAAFSN